MPFELGLAVSQDIRSRRQTWHVCEAVQYRVNKSLSDLDGSDIRIDGGTVRGVFAALNEVFARRDRQPSVQQMYRIYLVLRRNLPKNHETGRGAASIGREGVSGSHIRGNRTAQTAARILSEIHLTNPGDRIVS